MKSTKKVALILSIFALIGISCAYAITLDGPQKALKSYFKEEITLFEKEYETTFKSTFLKSCAKEDKEGPGRIYCQCALDGLIEKEVIGLGLENFIENLNPTKVFNFFDSEEGKDLARFCIGLEKLESNMKNL